MKSPYIENHIGQCSNTDWRRVTSGILSHHRRRDGDHDDANHAPYGHADRDARNQPRT